MAVLSRHRLPIGLVGLCVVLSVKCLYDVISCSLFLLHLCACLFYVLTLGVLGFFFLLRLLQPSVVGDPLLSFKSKTTQAVTRRSRSFYERFTNDTFDMQVWYM